MRLLPLLICLFGLSAMAQVKISGKFYDEFNEPVSDVTVLAMKAKDSTMIAYTSSKEAGDFSLNFQPVKDSVNITFSLFGYEEKVLKYPNISESISLGNILLKEDAEQLDELVIVADIPIRVKRDTLEFNASSFKVRPDANVEALLRELPGVEIDAEKNITVNGKKVSQFLVNGKPFFDRNGSVILQNLPADLINKVQVSDKKTKAEEFSGRSAQSDEASINFTIDEDKNKGLMGRVTGGYGTDERYEAAGLINYFQGDRKISLMASSNNINSSGFSMDEIFDNMGGGRSTFFSFGGRNMFGRSIGISRNDLIGINYSDLFFDKLDTNVSYNLNREINDNNNRSTTINLLPDGEFTTNSESSSRRENTQHNVTTDFELKLDENTKVYFNPSFRSNKNININENKSITFDENGGILNETDGTSTSDITSNSFDNSIQFTKKLDDKGKNFSLYIESTNSVTSGGGFTQSETLFYADDSTPDDIRNQEETTRSTNDQYSIQAKYSQPIQKDVFLDFNYDWKYDSQTDKLFTYNFDELTGQFSEFNDRLSTNTKISSISNSPTVGLTIDKEKLKFSIESGVVITNLNAAAEYMSNKYNIDRQFVNPFVTANVRYRQENGMSVYANYRYYTSNPSVMQMMPYERVNDPLNTIIGNEELDQTKTHRIFGGLNKYNFQMRTGWSIWLHGSYNTNSAATYSLFDENRKRTTTYRNIGDTYSVDLSGNWSKSFKYDEHTLRFGVSSRIRYTKDKGFTDGELFEGDTYSISPKAEISWTYGELLTITPSYELGFNQTNYTNYQISRRDNVTHNLSLQTTSYWPENWTWGNDFGYTYNSNLGAGFQRDFFLWNTSLSYTFLNKAMTAKVKVYDILNQNVGTSRMITATSIVDQENLVLQRYVMFSLTYKFDKFGGKSNNDGPPRRGGRRIIVM